jgi:mRNA interferase RelE/StbE
VTASNSLFIKQSAEKELKALPKADLTRIVDKIQSLADNPRPSGIQKMSGHFQSRIRRGDYRVLYTINDTDGVVEIIKIGDRREVCRK